MTTLTTIYIFYIGVIYIITEEGSDSDHLGFHTGHESIYHREGLYYGRLNPHTKEVECQLVASDTYLLPYTLIKADTRAPYVYFRIQGKEGHSPASEFYLRLKQSGILLSQYMTNDLTNYIVDKSQHRVAYEEPGYVVKEDLHETSQKKLRITQILKDRKLNENDIEEVMKINDNDPNFPVKKIYLITPEKTMRKFEKGFKKPEYPELKEIVQNLKNLFDVTYDKKAFLIAFSYSLFAPLAYLVRKQNLFFPNLIFLGLPETGKNSLLKLFLSDMWGVKSNLKVTGDFSTEFSSMKNMEGHGLPLVINDLQKQDYDKLKSYLLEGAMNTRGGSRGKPTLDIQTFDTMRAIAISSNYLPLGPKEWTSRFIIHTVKYGGVEKAQLWNAIAKTLEGTMYPVAQYFLDYVNQYLDFDQFMGYFMTGREDVKRSIIEYGHMILENLFQMVEYDFKLPPELKIYEEYEEDHFSVFLGWVQLALRKMEKETNYYERDYYDRNTITIRYEDSLYIRQSQDSYIIFPLAWKEFLKKFPDFPFQTMEGFAHAYPDLLEYSPRKFRSPDSSERKSIRVLIVRKMDLGDVASVQEKGEEAAKA